MSAKQTEINSMDSSKVKSSISAATAFIKSEKKNVGDEDLLNTPDQTAMCTMKEFLTTEGLTITGAIKKMQKGLKTNRKSLTLPKELTLYNAIERNKILIQRLNNSCKKDQGVVVFTKAEKVYAFNQSGQMLICFLKSPEESWNVDVNGELKNKAITQIFNAAGEKIQSLSPVVPPSVEAPEVVEEVSIEVPSATIETPQIAAPTVETPAAVVTE